MPTQMLLTAEIRRAIPPLYANEDKAFDDVIVVAKLFHPYGAGTWYVTEFDGEDTLFGFVELGMGGDEWGYFSLSELTELRALVGGREMPFQAIERDSHFKPARWGDIKGDK
jgi:hypothetical protein